MAEELQGLLDRIQKEGLEKAEAEKARIIAEAKKEAEKIVAKGKADVEQLKATANDELARLQSSGEAGLKQSARDVVISLEAEIKALLTRLVQQSVGEAMTPDKMAEILQTLAKAYASGNDASLAAMVSPAQLEALQKAFAAKLAETFRGGIELRPVPGISAGVKVSFNGTSVVHDFSAEAVSEMLCAYLNPRLLEIVRKSN